MAKKDKISKIKNEPVQQYIQTPSGSSFPEDITAPDKIPSPGEHIHQIVIPIFPNDNNFWIPDRIRNALLQMETGFFRDASFLCEALERQNPRISNALDLRINTVLGLPFKWKQNEIEETSKKKTKEILKVIKCYQDSHFINKAVLSKFKRWEIMMNIAPLHIVVEEIHNEELNKTFLVPRIIPFHPSNLWYNQAYKRFMLNTMDGVIEIFDNDDRFWVWNGEDAQNRAWMTGKVRSLAQHECQRAFAMRDLARYSEIHTIPVKKLFLLEEVNAPSKHQIEVEVQRLRNESTIVLPMQLSDDGKIERKMDVEIEYPKNNVSLETSLKQAEFTQDDIEICLTGRSSQNRAAHYQNKDSTGAIRQDILESDTDGIDRLIYRLVKLFCLMNYGDESLAPCPFHDTKSPRDREADSKTLINLVNSLAGLAVLGNDSPVEIDIEALLEEFAIPIKEKSKSNKKKPLPIANPGQKPAQIKPADSEDETDKPEKQ